MQDHLVGVCRLSDSEQSGGRLPAILQSPSLRSDWKIKSRSPFNLKLESKDLSESDMMLWWRYYDTYSIALMVVMAQCCDVSPKKTAGWPVVHGWLNCAARAWAICYKTCFFVTFFCHIEICTILVCPHERMTYRSIVRYNFAILVYQELQLTCELHWVSSVKNGLLHLPSAKLVPYQANLVSLTMKYWDSSLPARRSLN